MEQVAWIECFYIYSKQIDLLNSIALYIEEPKLFAMMNHETRIKIEGDLRGYSLSVSVIFEAGLMDIVYFSNSVQYVNAADSPFLKLKNLTFGGKIKRAKEVLAEFHSDLLVKYEDLFTNLKEFLEIRNKLAHCAIDWIDDHLLELDIWDVTESPNKFQYYSPTRYKRLDISQSIISSLNKIGPDIIALQNEVRQRLQQTDLAVYSVLISGGRSSR